MDPNKSLITDAGSLVSGRGRRGAPDVAQSPARGHAVMSHVNMDRVRGWDRKGGVYKKKYVVRFYSYGLL